MVAVAVAVAVVALCVAAVAARGAAAAAHGGAGAAGARFRDLADTIKLDELPCGHLRPQAGDFFRVADRKYLANPEKVPPPHHRPTPLLLRQPLLCLAQSAIELQDVGDVLGNLVAGAVAADDVAHRSGPVPMQLEV